MKIENLNQSQPIFWKGKICKLIKWETLNFGGKLKIKIAKEYPLEDAGLAHDLVINGHAGGKVILII